MDGPINPDYSGKWARLRFGGSLLLPVDGVEFGSTCHLIKSCTTANYGNWKGPLDVTYGPRQDPNNPDLITLPAATDADIAKRNAFLGVPVTRIWGGIREGKVSMTGFFYGGNRTPRLGNYAALLLYQKLDVAPQTIPVILNEVTYSRPVRGFLRFMASGETHGDFDPNPF